MLRIMRHPRRMPLRGLRYTTTTSDAAPPVLSKMRDDLKTALKSKDKPRLNVLRAMLSIAANASKGAAPIRTDVQVLALLKKRIAASRSACEEFAQAERDDLMAKQHAEIAVMDEYARQVKVFPEEEIAEAIEQAYQGLDEERRGKAENILNALLRPGGSLYGKPIDKSQVVRMVKDMVKTKTSPDLGDKLAS